MRFSPENRGYLARRTILKGALALPTAMAVGCGDGANEPIKVPETPAPIDHKITVLKELDSLPDTYIKSLLKERVYPIFSNKTPFVVSSPSGFEYPVNDSMVHVQLSDNEVISAIYAEQYNDSADSKYNYTSAQELSKLPIPLVGGFIKEDEMKIFQVAPDGTPFFNLNIPEGTPVFEGIRPLIIITKQRDELVAPDQKTYIQAYEKFLYIKEACSALIQNISADEVYKVMVEHSLPTTIEAVSQEGKRKPIEIVHIALDTSRQNPGRYNVLNDLGGLALALKAVENTDIESLIKQDFVLPPIIESLKAVPFSQNPLELMKEMYNWGLNYTGYETIKPRLSGDINKIP